MGTNRSKNARESHQPKEAQKMTKSHWLQVGNTEKKMHYIITYLFAPDYQNEI